jgi:hypothetical protein
MAAIIALIAEILQLATQLGPTIATLAVDFAPVEQAVAAIIAGKPVTDAQEASLQAVADQLHAAIQASPDTAT